MDKHQSLPEAMERVKLWNEEELHLSARHWGERKGEWEQKSKEPMEWLAYWFSITVVTNY